MKLTASELAIDWSGVSPVPDLDAQTAESRNLLYQAIDARLSAAPADVPATTSQPDALTLQVINVGILAADATSDRLAADALLMILQRVVDLSEQRQTSRMMLAASLAVGQRYHRLLSVEREARRAA